MTKRENRIWRIFVIVLVMTCTFAAMAGGQDTGAADPLEAIRVYKDRARKLGAKSNLPSAWNAFDKRLEAAAAGREADAEDLAALDLEGRRLVARAAFLREMQDSREPLETLLGRFDASLRELAALIGVPLDPALTGTDASTRLLGAVERRQLRRQVEVDSLRVECRRLSETTGGQTAAQDSLITALRVELSAVRQQLWDTQLRAGVAEADRSAAETALTQRQAREEAVQQIRADLGDAVGDVVTTAEGAIVVQVPGLNFGVGRASLAEGQGDLMDRLAAIVGRFPGAKVRVEGHTDDTGSRAANLSLSRRRADTVAGGLERRLELGEGSVEVIGYGPDRPVAPNSTAAGRAHNRRIDIVIVPVG